MKYRFRVNDELLANLIFLSIVGMYFLGLVVIPNVYIWNILHVENNHNHQVNDFGNPKSTRHKEDKVRRLLH